MALDLTPLLAPRSIAVVGASADTNVIRGRLLHVLKLRGFAGPIYPVTRSAAEVQGLRAYSSVGDLPEPVDLAVIVIPAAVVPETLEACGRAGVKAAVVISSGFAEESGEAGKALQGRLRDIAERHGMLVCGPNSEGVVNVLDNVVATFSPALEHVDGPLLPEIPRVRTIGVTAQSGAISFAYFNRGRPRHLRFSYLVSSGNEAVLEGLDYVEWMLDERGRTDIVLMYVEAIRSGARFREVATKAADLRKPLVVAKVGRSEAGRRAALSHTGSLAGSDEVYAAMFRHFGVIRADDLDEMLDIAAGFSFCPVPRGRRVALLSASGGGAVWMSDLLSAQGLEVPPLDDATRREIDALIPSYGSSQNPVDLTAQSVRQVGYARVIDLLRRSPAVDSVLVVGSLASEALIERDHAALARLAAESDKPIVFCAYTLASPRALWLLASAGIAAYTNMANCARALAALAGYGAFQTRWRGRQTAAGTVPRPRPVPTGADPTAAASRVPSATATPRGASVAATSAAQGGDNPASGRAASASPPGASIPATSAAPGTHNAAPGQAASVASAARADIARRLASARRTVPEAEAKDVLAAYGVPRAGEALVHTEEATVAVAAQLGYPVALKVQSPDIAHKTEAGALALHLASESALRAAYRQVLASARAHAPDAEIRGVLVQRMAAPGREVIVGVTTDAVFGPMLMVGLGGVWVEVLRDVALAPVPIDHDAALELIRTLRGAPLLDGIRGEPRADIEALVALVVAISCFAAEHAEAVAEVDLNPVLVHPAGQGVTVVDALIVPRR